MLESLIKKRIKILMILLFKISIISLFAWQIYSDINHRPFFPKSIKPAINNPFFEIKGVLDHWVNKTPNTISKQNKK